MRNYFGPKFLRWILAGITLMFAGIGHAEVTEEVKAKVGEALAASESGDHVKSFEIWNSLLESGESTLGEEAFKVVRSMVYRESLKSARLIDENCDVILNWVEKGIRPGSPDYSMAADSDYPSLLLVGGTCFYNQGRFEEAYSRLTAARSEFIRVQDTDTRAVIAEASRVLELVEANIIMTGDYVTNPGAFQAWIGRVQSRSGDFIQVTLTYVNRDRASNLAKGEMLELRVSDCKELAAISADAALQGWK